MVTRFTRSLGRWRTSVHAPQVLASTFRSQRTESICEPRWRCFSAVAAGSNPVAATVVDVASTGVGAQAASTSAGSYVADVSNFVSNVVSPAASNGPAIPGIPFNRSYPDFNITVSSLQDDSWSYTLAGLDMLHTQGYEWWVAASILTAGLRLCTMPIFLYTVRMGARMQALQEEMGKFTDMLKEAQRRGDPQLSAQAALGYRNFLKSKGLRPFLPMGVMLLQLPLFYNLFKGMRQLASQAHLVPDAMAPITAFTALGLTTPVFGHLPDPYFILPIAQTVLGLTSLSLNRNIAGMPQLGLTAGGMRLIFGTLTTVFGAISTNFPAILQFSFAVTSGTMLFQQALLRVPLFTRALGFPPEWPLSEAKIAALAAKRGAVSNPMLDGMKGFEPLFRRASLLAAGQWRAEPSHAYVTIMGGLRDPGAPPPPPVLVSSTAAAAAASAVASGAAETASGAAVLTMANAKGAVPPGGALLLNRPKKVKQK